MIKSIKLGESAKGYLRNNQGRIYWLLNMQIGN